MRPASSARRAAARRRRIGVKVDILTGTLGKALGGAMGGFIAAAQPIVDLLRQRARPYLFSNALPPPVLARRPQGDRPRARRATTCAPICSTTPSTSATAWARPGFDLLPGETPIIPVMLDEARLAQDMAAALYERGIYVAGFFFPVVPQGQGAHPHADVGGALSPRTSTRRSRPSPMPGGSWE